MANNLSHLDKIYDVLQIEYLSEIASEQYYTYQSQLLAELSKVPTSVFVTAIIAICLPPIIALTIFEQHNAKCKVPLPVGCKKLEMKIGSNLSNEFDETFSKGRPASTEETSAEWWRVKSMWIYPVKSCAGIELNHTSILTRGMEYDRQFTFAVPKTAKEGEEKKEQEWKFITQRTLAKMALIKTQMWVPDFNSPDYVPHSEDIESEGVLIMSFPYQEAGLGGIIAKFGAMLTGSVPEKQFRVPFNPTEAQIEKAGYKREKVTVWNDTVTAINMELEVPQELATFLGINGKLGLFRIDDQELREVHRNAPKAADIGFQPVTAFQDSYPLHLLNLASLRDFEKMMPKDKDTPRLSAKRFRPNIIITGPEAYVEETWKKIKIGFYEYDVSCRTTRCRLPNVDPQTGIRHESLPDKALRSFRNVDPGLPTHGCLGMQCTPLQKTSEMKCGDEVTALEHGEHVKV